MVVRNARLLAYLGDWAYDLAMSTNRWIARVRRALGLPYWSFSAWAKLQVKHAVNFIGEFQRVWPRRRAGRCRWRDLRPHPSRRDRDDRRHHYINTGDWVESCTAVVEHFDGRMEMIRWPHILATAPLPIDRLVPVTIDGHVVDARGPAAAGRTVEAA